eukprot:363206-Chlamydomonas_euryale.AAC.1
MLRGARHNPHGVCRVACASGMGFAECIHYRHGSAKRHPLQAARSSQPGLGAYGCESKKSGDDLQEGHERLAHRAEGEGRIQENPSCWGWENDGRSSWGGLSRDQLSFVDGVLIGKVNSEHRDSPALHYPLHPHPNFAGAKISIACTLPHAPLGEAACMRGSTEAAAVASMRAA